MSATAQEGISEHIFNGALLSAMPRQGLSTTLPNSRIEADLLQAMFDFDDSFHQKVDVVPNGMTQTIMGCFLSQMPAFWKNTGCGTSFCRWGPSIRRRTSSNSSKLYSICRRLWSSLVGPAQNRQSTLRRATHAQRRVAMSPSLIMYRMMNFRASTPWRPYMRCLAGEKPLGWLAWKQRPQGVEW